MAQFDVYQNIHSKTKKHIPYLLDVQVNLLEDLETRIVAPLLRASEIKIPIKKLNLLFEINHTKVFMLPQELAGIPIKLLGEKVGSLKEHRIDIMNALDFLFSGI